MVLQINKKHESGKFSARLKRWSGNINEVQQLQCGQPEQDDDRHWSEPWFPCWLFQSDADARTAGRLRCSTERRRAAGSSRFVPEFAGLPPREWPEIVSKRSKTNTEHAKSVRMVERKFLQNPYGCRRTRRVAWGSARAILNLLGDLGRYLRFFLGKKIKVGKAEVAELNVKFGYNRDDTFA